MKSLSAIAIACLCLMACSKTGAERAAEHLHKGQEYAAKKDYRSAAVEYKVAAQNAPHDAEPVYQLGMLYLAAGAGPLAIDTLQRAARIDPHHAKAAVQLAIIQVASGHADTIEAARAILLDYVTKNPKDAAAAGALAVAEAKLNHTGEARTRLMNAIQLDPSDMRPASTMVALYAAKGEIAAANDLATSVEAGAANSPAAALLSAQVAAAGHDMAKAEAGLQRALKIKPDFAPALEMLLRKRLIELNMSGAEQVARSLSQQPDKRWWTTYARILFGERKTDEAIAEFKRVLVEHPGEADLRNEFSALLQATGRPADAETVVNGTLTASKADPGALLQRAALSIDKGDLATAASAVKALRDQKALSAALSYQESRLMAAQGDIRGQGDALTEALRYDPKLLRARLELSRLLVSTGKARNALAILEQAGAADKGNPEFVFHKNAALIASGDWSQARHDVDAQLASSKSPGFLFQDALLRVHDNDLAGATKALETALAAAPADPASLELMGEILRRQGQETKYAALLRDAAKRNPGAVQLQMLLAAELMRSGDKKGALAAYETARANGGADLADPAIALLEIEDGAPGHARQRLLERVKVHDSVGARLILAQIESQAKDGSAEAAVQHYVQALKLDPANAVASNNLANLLVRLGKLNDAAFWAEKGIASAPASPAMMDTLGWIYYLQGKYAAALPHLEKSLTLKDRPVAHYHLAAALLRNGIGERAHKEFDLALHQDPNSPERVLLASLFQAPGH